MHQSSGQEPRSLERSVLPSSFLDVSVVLGLLEQMAVKIEESMGRAAKHGELGEYGYSTSKK